MASTAAQAQFADACDLAPTVAEGVFSFDLSGATAGDTPFTPSCAESGPATIDQWIRYVPTNSGAASISTLGLSRGDTVLSVHDTFDVAFDCAFAPFQVRACNDDSGSPQSRIVLAVTAGQPLLIRIAGANDSQPAGSVRIEPFIPLPGDICSTAIPADEGLNTYDATLAVLNNFESCRGYRDVWFTHTPAVRGGLTVSTCGQATEASISIFAVCGGRILACSPYGECSAKTAVEAGIPLIIRIANDSAVGPEQFSISLDPNAIPFNDSCATPLPVVVGDNPFDNTFATDGFPVTSCDSGGIFSFDSGLDMWYTFTPPVSGTYDITTANSIGLSDTVLAVYASCDDSPFICNDDSRGFLSFIRTPLFDDQIYLIQVSGAGLPNAGSPTDRGQGLLTIRASIPPVNDSCANARTVTEGVSDFDIYDATTGPQSLSCLASDRSTFNDVWFRFVPPLDGPVEATLLAGGAAGSLSYFADCGDNVSSDTAGFYFDTTTYVAVPRIIVNGVAGTAMYFRVAYLDYPDATLPPRGDGQLFISQPSMLPPTNDRCDAAALIISSVTSIDLTGSVKDCATDQSPQFDTSAAVTDNDIFYRFIAPLSQRYTIAIHDGVDYPEFAGLVVSVYDACGASPLAGSFTFGDAPADSVAFDGIAGQAYIIRVGSVLAFGSSIVLTGSIELSPFCAADFNRDGSLNADDLGDFITCYFDLGCTAADFNGDGSRNADDLGDFISAYFGGCN